MKYILPVFFRILFGCGLRVSEALILTKQQQSLSKKQFNQLSDLTWIEQMYNLVFLGPLDVGENPPGRSGS
ncbi:hypothetical protein ACTWQL_22805 [Pseudalkalibacillus sp. R45]|uniref:hypothetical protein n=1 Tax=Pseudalkalibacillus sp. R45 TaxID=3457433 RepID=UPI003FCC8B62